MRTSKAQIKPEKAQEVEAMLAAAWAFKKQRRAEEVREEQEAEALSYTSAYLLEFRERRGDPYTPLKINGPESSFETGTKKLCDEDVATMGSLMGSKGYTLTNLRDVRGQTLFGAALIFVATTRHDDENDPRFGSYDEVISWMHEPGLAEVVDVLRTFLLERNPFIDRIYQNAKKKITLGQSE